MTTHIQTPIAYPYFQASNIASLAQVERMLFCISACNKVTIQRSKQQQRKNVDEA